MGRTLLRMLTAVGLAMIAAILIWAGHRVLESGRGVMGQEARFASEYFLGSHLLWLMSGVVVAVILNIGAPATTRRPVGSVLAAALVPILMLLTIYAWGNPDTPNWLRRVAIHEWLLSGEAQAAAAVLAGVLLGTASWHRVIIPTQDEAVREQA